MSRVLAGSLAVLLAGTASSAAERVDPDAIAAIKMEAFQRSQVMDTVFHLTDVHGPRLHGSPGFDAAAAWSVGRLREWGLEQVRLETWPSSQPSWELESFTVELLEPAYDRIRAYPVAFTPATEGALEGTPVLLRISGPADFEAWRGKLRGAIVMNAAELREGRHDPDEPRLSDTRLFDLGGALDPGEPRDYASELAEWKSAEEKEREIARFFKEEGVAALLLPSRRARGVLRVTNSGTLRLEDNAPSFVLAHEAFGRLLRLLERGHAPRLRVESRVTTAPASTGANVVAEISGSDPRLADELVMLGAHLDSWHAGTGATDNAAGCAVAMEAVRILKALGLRPRRTVRLALWGSEELDYGGSRHHVQAHFADIESQARKPAHSRLSAYFNLDNGTGRVRGVYLQGNESVRPIFEALLAPFGYLGATTLSTENTSGTDHLIFDAVGLPGFQFIQDPMEYEALTHHTDQDVYERVSEPDLKQAAALLAAFVYHTALREERLPRKPAPTGADGR